MMCARCAERAIAFRLTLLGGVLLIGGIALTHATRVEDAPARVSLAMLPSDIPGWRGQDVVRFTPAVERTLGVDDYLNRVYAAADGAPVSFYVGYYASQRQGDAIHSPMNCLPGAGWQPVSNRRIAMSVVDSTGAPRAISLNQYIVEKAGERLVVLYWYQSHGRIVASEYLGRALMVYDAIRLNRTDAALVRVIAPIMESDPDVDRAAAQAASFVAAVFPALAALLPV